MFLARSYSNCSERRQLGVAPPGDPGPKHSGQVFCFCQACGTRETPPGRCTRYPRGVSFRESGPQASDGSVQAGQGRDGGLNLGEAWASDLRGFQNLEGPPSWAQRRARLITRL
jgi:hypothetical protein